jgi:Trp operon repressor
VKKLTARKGKEDTAGMVMRMPVDSRERNALGDRVEELQQLVQELSEQLELEALLYATLKRNIEEQLTQAHAELTAILGEIRKDKA